IWNNNREISINGKDLKKVEVYNALGQKVYEDQISGNSHTFNLNTIQGAYIIKAYDQNKLSKTAKITIAK
ncbi:MAG: T9SS type A sorting domain-containing protein, partial [Bacteroidales bacterium]|nr:T9SS type A sorting domain-containing protein [Bacteroidales bacterium]